MRDVKNDQTSIIKIVELLVKRKVITSCQVIHCEEMVLILQREIKGGLGGKGFVRP